MVANNYCTAAEISAVLSNEDLAGTAVSGVTFTALLDTLAGYASRAIDKFTSRKPGAYYVNADVTRYPVYGRRNYSPVAWNDERLGGGVGSEGLRLYVGELAAAPTSVSVSLTGSLTTYTLYAATDYIPGPFDALDNGRPYEWLELDIINGSRPYWSTFPKGNKVVGKFGWSQLPPDDVKMATIIQAARWLKRGAQGFQDKINIVEAMPQLAYLNQLDDDVEMMVAHYRKQAI